METQVNIITPTDQQKFDWPGKTATATVFASSDENIQQGSWRFGELEILGSGSMPQLEGFSRHIALLEGEGLLVMHNDDDRTELLEQGEHNCVDLTGLNEVELIDGPVRLLDIVVDAKLYSTSAFTLSEEANMHPVDAEFLILFGLEGERMHCILDEHEFTLTAKQWVRVDHPPTTDIQCTNGRALVVAVKGV